MRFLSLFLRLDEFVILHRHLAAQSLAGMSCWAVSVDDVSSCERDSSGQHSSAPCCCLYYIPATTPVYFICQLKIIRTNINHLFLVVILYIRDVIILLPLVLSKKCLFLWMHMTTFPVTHTLYVQVQTLKYWTLCCQLLYEDIHIHSICHVHGHAWTACISVV